MSFWNADGSIAINKGGDRRQAQGRPSTFNIQWAADESGVNHQRRTPDKIQNIPACTDMPVAGKSTKQCEGHFGDHFGNRKPLNSVGEHQRGGTFNIFGDDPPPVARPASALKAWENRGHGILSDPWGDSDPQTERTLLDQSLGAKKIAPEVAGHDIGGQSLYPDSQRQFTENKTKEVSGSNIMAEAEVRPKDTFQELRGKSVGNTYSQRDKHGYIDVRSGFQGTDTTMDNIVVGGKGGVKKGNHINFAPGHVNQCDSSAVGNMFEGFHQVAQGHQPDGTFVPPEPFDYEAHGVNKPQMVLDYDMEQARGFPIKYDPSRKPPGDYSKVVIQGGY